MRTSLGRSKVSKGRSRVRSPTPFARTERTPRLTEDRDGHERPMTNAVESLRHLVYKRRVIRPKVLGDRVMFARDELLRFLRDGEGPRDWP